MTNEWKIKIYDDAAVTADGRAGRPGTCVCPPPGIRAVTNE